MSKDLMEEISELKDYFVEIRRHIHQNPELGFEEVETTKLIRKELENYGVEIASVPIETGVVGIIEGTKKSDNPGVIALRADIDALPILEETGLDWESKTPGIMHACGHDGHTAMLLGAAKILSRRRDEFAGIVKLIFQPAEEQLDGAKSVIKAGVLENPKVEKIVGVHGGGEVEIGTVGIYPGSFQTSADMFTVKMIGDGGHAGYPHRGNDSLLAASQAVVNLQSIISREIDAVEKTVLSICKINGGSAFNIIPKEVEFSGTVRSHNKDVRASMEKRMNRIIKGIADAYGCRHELEYIYGIPQVFNDHKITSEIKESASKALGAENVIELDRPLMGSEDFAFYLEKIPGAIFRVGISGGRKVELHHPEFDFPDEAIPVGIAVFVQYVLNTSQ